MARANARRIGAIVGDLAAVEEIFALKDLMTRLGVANLDCRQDGSVLDPKWGRASYLFNSTIAGIDNRRRASLGRRQPAPRGGGAQCAHPQTLAHRRGISRSG